MAKRKTREEWLGALTAALRPKFKAAGLPIPAKVRVSCSWPSSGGLKRKNKIIGQMWEASQSASGHYEVFISPALGNAVRVGGVLVHELLHVALESMHPAKDVSHGPIFKAAMPLVGLTGKATATGESEALKRELETMIRKVGKYPHAAITFSAKDKVQTTRLLKIECPGCGYVARTTAKWIESGFPICPCGEQFEAA